jgi:translation elongation factor EF-4
LPPPARISAVKHPRAPPRPFKTTTPASLLLSTTRCGFLGPLHCEVFLQRLDQEHGAAVVSTPPTVPYELEVAGQEGRLRLESPAAYPKSGKARCSSAFRIRRLAAR